jgi:hypothetical protein
LPGLPKVLEVRGHGSREEDGLECEKQHFFAIQTQRERFLTKFSDKAERFGRAQRLEGEGKN